MPRNPFYAHLDRFRYRQVSQLLEMPVLFTPLVVPTGAHPSQVTGKLTRTARFQGTQDHLDRILNPP
jgi:hypothetical protein